MNAMLTVSLGVVVCFVHNKCKFFAFRVYDTFLCSNSRTMCDGMLVRTIVSRVCLLMFEIICLTDAGATVAAKREKGFCVCV